MLFYSFVQYCKMCGRPTVTWQLSIAPQPRAAQGLSAPSPCMDTEPGSRSTPTSLTTATTLLHRTGKGSLG